MASAPDPQGNIPPGVTSGQVQSAVQQQATDPPPPAVNPCPGKTWVEFLLLDMEGNPMGGKRYKVTLPDGSVKQGTLDQSGRVRFDSIQPGTATISYLDYDKEAWERV